MTYTHLKPKDKKLMVEIAMDIHRALDGKPMLHGWSALMLNTQRLGRVMLATSSKKELKERLREYLALTDKWITTYPPEQNGTDED